VIIFLINLPSNTHPFTQKKQDLKKQKKKITQRPEGQVEAGFALFALAAACKPPCSPPNQDPYGQGSAPSVARRPASSLVCTASSKESWDLCPQLFY
jgi:hypothetical protein